MKKTLLTVVLAVCTLLVATSGFNQQRFGTAPGDMAPMLNLDDTATTKTQNSQTAQNTLADLRGNYVLLTFWASDNALSRQQCKQYDLSVATSGRSDVKHVAVNLDKSPALCQAITAADKLANTSVYNATGQQAQLIIDEFGLAHGYGTLLIGPDGRVVCANPDPGHLADLI